MGDYYEKYEICQAIEDVEDLMSFINRHPSSKTRKDHKMCEQLMAYKETLFETLEMKESS